MLVGHPARGLGTEQDGRPALRRTGEDAVAGTQLLVQLAVGDVTGSAVDHARLVDAVHGPGIVVRRAVAEVPVTEGMVGLVAEELPMDDAAGQRCTSLASTRRWHAGCSQSQQT